MKLKIWILCSVLVNSGTILAAQKSKNSTAPRSTFLGQIPNSMLDKEGYLSFNGIAKEFEKASTDVRAEDFETYSFEKFRLTSEALKQLGSQSQEELVFPDMEKDSSSSSSILFNGCQTVDLYGRGHESYAHRYPDTGFIFSGGWIPHDGGGDQSLGVAMHYMKGKTTAGEGYRIDIPENSAGFYSDYPAPLSVTYRRASSTLIGAFRHANGRIDGFKVCFSRLKAVCHIRAIAKGRYDEPAETFTTLVNLIVTGENVTEAKSRTLAKTKRDLGCLVNGSESIEDYVAGECRGESKSAACETAKNACSAYVKAKKEIQCGDDLSRMNFYAFDKKNNRWLPATSK